MMKEQLKTEPIFEKLTVPCSKAELEELEKSLISQGCISPIITWNSVILDGHKRYRICMLEGIVFETTEMYFPSLEDAILWICRKRTLHLSKSRLIYRYLVGKWDTVGIIINRRKSNCFPDGNMLTNTDAEERKYSTSREIGRELGIHHATIEKFKRFSTALDVIYEKDPVLFDLLIKEEYKASYEKIFQMSTRTQRALQEERRRFQNRFQKRIGRTPYMVGANPAQRSTEAGTAHTEEMPLTVGIKDMPAFDPEMELKGLALTIPTWMNAIERARSKTDMTLVSDLLKEQLSRILDQFGAQIDQMMEVLNHDPEQ